MTRNSLALDHHPLSSIHVRHELTVLSEARDMDIDIDVVIIVLYTDRLQDVLKPGRFFAGSHRPVEVDLLNSECLGKIDGAALWALVVLHDVQQIGQYRSERRHADAGSDQNDDLNTTTSWRRKRDRTPLYSLCSFASVRRRARRF